MWLILFSQDFFVKVVFGSRKVSMKEKNTKKIDSVSDLV